MERVRTFKTRVELELEISYSYEKIDSPNYFEICDIKIGEEHLSYPYRAVLQEHEEDLKQLCWDDAKEKEKEDALTRAGI